MFIEAIEKVSEFTRPIYIISRNFGSTNVIPGSSTLFLVNNEGWALTCGHVVQELATIDKINNKYQNFRAELSALKGKDKKRRNINALEKKYGYNPSITIQALSMIVACAEGALTFTIRKHPEYDVALIKIDNFTRLLCNSFPVFPSDTSKLKQGIFLCRLGFPFPEFTNYEYNSTTDNIGWTQTGRQNTPIFPLEGMITRFLIDKNGKSIGFEMSTPGLKGQSGGPVFDTNGIVWGMQSATAHIDLDFDVDLEVMRKGQLTRRKDSAFLHVGHSVHVDILKEFMLDNKVRFDTK